MDDKDVFAVWLAAAVLQTNGDPFGAASLDHMMENATSAEFNAKLAEAASQAKRPGDFGVEFHGSLLPVLLISLGRDLWESYSKELIDKGGKLLANATLDAIKAIFRQKIEAPRSVEVTDEQIRIAASRSGFSSEQTEKLLSTLHSPDLAKIIAAQ